MNFGSPSRETGFTLAAAYFRANGGKSIVETGCYWNEAQGCSTVHLAELAGSVGGEFNSVDENAQHVEFSRKAIAHIPNAKVHHMDSLEWLGRFTGRIDYLYLDAFDHDINHPKVLPIYNVAELGACLGKMNEHSVILMDDWNFGKGELQKCSLSRELLLYRGWHIISEDYQLLFAR